MKSHHVIFALLIALTPVLAAAQDDGIQVPDEVKPYIEKGMIPIALETGDLNGDGTKDFVLVLSTPSSENGGYDEAGDVKRPTLVLTRDSSGRLLLAARNDAVAFCRNCGGVFGDPFEGVEIQGSSFTVSNYGGSNWRWSNAFRFNYSRRDRTWQLVRVEESSFHTFEPDKVKTTVYTPPKSFGLINFADFDPENFKGKGKK